ncbi:SUKH-4 family immunity protein [Streptomyces xiamenensis]
MDDTEMAAALAGCVTCPYPGTWQGSPFAERTVGGVRYGVVAVDPGLSALVVRRADGSLWGLPAEGVPHLELAERAVDVLTDALLGRFAALDAEAVGDENSFRCVAAEELGYGTGG